MSHSSKTWDLAERSRKVSKGQAKIFLTRSAGEEQRLAKLTHHLDKEKAARESQLSYAQKLLLKRYGGGKVGDGETNESRTSARDRSQTYDPTFITRGFTCKDENHPCPEITGRARAASGSSCDLDEGSSTRGLTEIPRVHSQTNVSTGKDKDAGRKISFSVEDLLKTRSSCSGSDGEIYKGSQSLNCLSTKFDTDQERRPRAVSEILPPISLPPIFKNSGQTGVSAGGGRKTSFTGKVTGRPKVAEANGRNKVLIGQKHPGTRKTPKDSNRSTDDKTVNNELGECRYLRTRNLDD